MKINITVPAHNEEKILAKNLTAIFSALPILLNDFDWTLVVAENGSTDTTRKISEKFATQHSQVISLSLKKADKWSAIQAGWAAAPAEVYVFFDADLSTDLNCLLPLLTAIKDADLAIGTRHQKNSQVNRSLCRSFISRGYCSLAKTLLRLPFSDFQCGFKAIRHGAWKKLSGQINNGWFADTELLAFGQMVGMKIKEIPVRWTETKKRSSKIKLPHTAIDFILKIFQLKTRLKKISN